MTPLTVASCPLPRNLPDIDIGWMIGQFLRNIATATQKGFCPTISRLSLKALSPLGLLNKSQVPFGSPLKIHHFTSASSMGYLRLIWALVLSSLCSNSDYGGSSAEVGVPGPECSALSAPRILHLPSHGIASSIPSLPFPARPARPSNRYIVYLKTCQVVLYSHLSYNTLLPTDVPPPQQHDHISTLSATRYLWPSVSLLISVVQCYRSRPLADAP
ncbi:uncharacterized protein ARMOST_14973 [Armillaria ostoyae]|uniref:Uncharacterized protein n=1 Tax=Armillaria ostoyae TaxID=47428 RepID=A0A284RS65_ARMOS|nr:uncharacterized protein ARMOST_14973 [Armillaria ostoyae]